MIVPWPISPPQSSVPSPSHHNRLITFSLNMTRTIIKRLYLGLVSPPQSSPPPPSPIFISFSLNTAGTIIKRLPLARLTSNQSRSSIALRASFSPFSSLVRHLSRLRLHLSHLTLYLSSFSFLIYMSYIPVYCASSNGNGFLHHILIRLQHFSLRNPFPISTSALINHLSNEPPLSSRFFLLTSATASLSPPYSQTYDSIAHFLVRFN